MKRALSRNRCLMGGLMLMIVLMLASCATAPKEFDPNVSGPQVIVEPDSVSMGVATLTKTPIVFRGKGFQPEDSVFITLQGVKKGDQMANVPIADAEVDKNGNFTASVSTLMKVTEFIRGQLGTGKNMENIIVVTQPPMPAGAYTAKAVSMDSGKKAECKLTVREPSLMDRFKDWMGVQMGKIQKK
jgi:hypothetical protein